MCSLANHVSLVSSEIRSPVKLYENWTLMHFAAWIFGTHLLAREMSLDAVKTWLDLTNLLTQQNMLK